MNEDKMVTIEIEELEEKIAPSGSVAVDELG